MKGESYIATIHTKCKDIVMLVGEGICCSSRFQNKWKYGKSPLSKLFLVCANNKHQEKTSCLGMQSYSHAPSPIDVALRYMKLQAHPLNIQQKDCFSSWVHGIYHKPQEGRHTHTHTHTHWQHMTTECNDITIHSSKSWKSFNYNCCLQPGDEEQHFSSWYY